MQENETLVEEAESAIVQEGQEIVEDIREETSGKQEEELGIFPQILEGMGDHHSLSYGIWHPELPIILLDEGEFHFYSGKTVMEEAGDWMMDGHKVVSTTTGKGPTLDMSITNLVAMQWIGIITLFIVMWRIAAKYKKNPRKAPSGFQNAIESVIVFIRDEVVAPNVGSAKLAKSLLPFHLSLFFFILFGNLFGLIPGGHSYTGAVGTTGALAFIAAIVINVSAIKTSGIKHFFHHLLGGAPVFMAPIMVPIEIVGLFSKPFALCVRLFANMTAGHMVMYALIAMIFMFKDIWFGVAPASVAFSLFVLALEVFVGFLQAYIFTILTSVFIGLAVGDGEHH